MTRLYLAYPIKGVDFDELNRMVAKRKTALAQHYPGIEFLDCRDIPACPECPPQGEGDCLASHHEYEDFIRSDLKAMLECDGIVLNFNWFDSTGCRNELAVALISGLDVYIATQGGILMDMRRVMWL